MAVASFPQEGNLLILIYNASACSLTISHDRSRFPDFEDLFRTFAANSGHPFRKDLCLERVDNEILSLTWPGERQV